MHTFIFSYRHADVFADACLSGTCLYLIFIITLFYIFYTKEPQFILDRLSNLLNFSESARGNQISEVMNRFYENRFNMIFGYGLGSAYREIYILDPNINIGVYRSLINLNYDIENGHITLLYRLGIFGCLVYVFGIFKHFKICVHDITGICGIGIFNISIKN